MKDRPLPRNPVNRCSGGCSWGGEEKVQLGSSKDILIVSHACSGLGPVMGEGRGRTLLT